MKTFRVEELPRVLSQLRAVLDGADTMIRLYAGRLHTPVVREGLALLKERSVYISPSFRNFAKFRWGAPNKRRLTLLPQSHLDTSSLRGPLHLSVEF